MIIIGIDLSGPANILDTAISVFKPEGNRLALLDSPEHGSDAAILGLVERFAGDELVFGLDAPLSYNPGGGDRPADAELRRLVNQTDAKVGVMPPTFTRMCYLTLRGIHLAHLLGRSPGVRVVEVHPTASMALQGADPQALAQMRESGPMRQKLTWWLENQGLAGLKPYGQSSDHLIASYACALAAWKWTQNKCVWKHPAKPPHFPFDFVC